MRSESGISMRAMNMVERELQSGERIEWMGQPNPKLLARKIWPLVLFGIPWTAFSVFWVLAASKMTLEKEGLGVFEIFPVFGLPFVLIGIVLLSAPVLVKKAAANRVYAITDRRALIIQGGRKLRVQSFTPEQLTDISRVERPDGSGDILFNSTLAHQLIASRTRARVSHLNGFQAVANVRQVEEKLQALAACQKF